MSTRKGTRLVTALGFNENHIKEGVYAPHYQEVVYAFEGKEAKPTKLIQNALHELLQVDSIFVLATPEVKEHWLESGLFEKHCGHPSVKPIDLDPDDPWNVFNATSDALSAGPLGDEETAPETIIYDVTHGFRAQPLFGMAAVAHTLGEWSRQRLGDPPEMRILYGAYEARKRDVTSEREVAPIWELTDFVLATRWNAALDALMRFGRADDIEQLGALDGQRAQASMQAEAQSSGEQPGPAAYKKARVAAQLGARAKAFADDLVMNRLYSLLPGDPSRKRSPSSVRQLFNYLEDEHVLALEKRLPPVGGAMAQLKQRLEPLLTDSSPQATEALPACVELAQLYGELQRFAEQAALLRETTISLIGRASGHRYSDPGGPCDIDRKRATDLLGSWRKDAALDDVPVGLREIAAHATELVDLRNDLLHCGLRNEPKSAAKLGNKLKIWQRRVAQAVEAVSSAKRGDGSNRSAAYLNLSNHPLEQWSAEQLEAARDLGLGDPIDLPDGMPLVPPDASSADVQRLAERLADQALALNAAGAFVAGEFTLTAALVSALQARGVRCFSATTEREVKQTQREDGSLERQSVFRFVQWREYPPSC